MRFALLGYDDQSSQLLRAIAASPRHELVAAAEITREQLAEFGLRTPVEPWESLLARSDAEAVIFSSGADSTLAEEQLKRFTQAAIPLVVIHPACDVMFAYEVEMMRREVGGIIMPVVLEWWDPAMVWLRSWTASSKKSGTIEQVIWERNLSDRSSAGALRQFSRDVWQIRQLIGPINSVNVAGATEVGGSFANVTIHCQGEGNLSARWSVTPGGPGLHSRLLIVTSQATAVLIEDPLNQERSIQVQGGQHHEQRFPRWDGGAAVLDRVEEGLKGSSAEPSWSDICFDLEAVDSVAKSVRRKRAIDVHTSEASEDQTFKGFMAAAGCLILTCVVFAFVFLAVFEGFRVPLQAADGAGVDGKPEPWPLWLRMWPVYPLLVFLVLQSLLVLAKRPRNKVASGAGNERVDSGVGADR